MDKPLWPPRASLVLIAAGSAFLLSWFLPVMQGFPGWQAFRVSLSPIWPFEGYEVRPWGFALLTVSSALTNVVFIALIVDLAARRRLSTRLVVSILAIATALDLYWLVFTGEDRTDLRIGYYVWLGSFLLLIVGACISPRHVKGASDG